MTSTPKLRISSRLDSESRSAARTLIFGGLLSRALPEISERVAGTSDFQQKFVVFALDQPRAQRSLRGLREAGLKFVVFDRGVQRALGTVGQAARVERALAAIREQKLEPPCLLAHAQHEKGHVFDAEVAPIIAIVQNEAAVVGVTVDPRRERARHARMLDQSSVVMKASPGIEHDRALARAAFGRRKAEEFRMIGGTHREPECSADQSAGEERGNRARRVA